MKRRRRLSPDERLLKEIEEGERLPGRPRPRSRQKSAILSPTEIRRLLRDIERGERELRRQEARSSLRRRPAPRSRRSRRTSA